MLCSKVVLLVSRHRLVEVELDVLRDVELVVVIVFDAVLQQAVNELADARDWSALRQFCEVV